MVEQRSVKPGFPAVVRGNEYVDAFDRGCKPRLAKEFLPGRWLVVSWYQNFNPVVLEYGDDAVIVEICR